MEYSRLKRSSQGIVLCLIYGTLPFFQSRKNEQYHPQKISELLWTSDTSVPPALPFLERKCLLKSSYPSVTIVHWSCVEDNFSFCFIRFWMTKSHIWVISRFECDTNHKILDFNPNAVIRWEFWHPGMRVKTCGSDMNICDQRAHCGKI